MYVGLKQPLGDGERYVTPARAAAKETTYILMNAVPRSTGNTNNGTRESSLPFAGASAQWVIHGFEVAL